MNLKSRLPKHTPTPWRIARTNGGTFIAGATPGYLAEIRACRSPEQAQADAELIFKAVNAHADYLRLHDMLSDMIEGGRLKEVDIPDDYQAIVEQLAILATLDPK